MFTLYHFILATCGIKVRLVLSEKSIGYVERILDPDEGDLSSPEYLKLNPAAVVPTLVHDDRVLVESSVIMNYLEDVCPEISLRPESAYDRARMNMWMKLADDVYLPALGVLSYTTLLRPKFLAMSAEAREQEYAKTKDQKRRALKRDWIEFGLESDSAPEALKNLTMMLNRIESSLEESQYLAGKSYSLADSALTPFVYRLSLMNLLEQPGVARPRLIAWWNRIQRRSSFEEVISSKVDSGIEAMITAVTEPELPKLQRMLMS